MPFFRFSRRMCTCLFSRHFFAPFVFVVILWLFFLNVLYSVSRKWRQMLFMLELKQPYYDHLVIQQKKTLNCVTRQNVGWTCGQEESASTTNQEADDRLLTTCARNSIQKANNKPSNLTRKIAKNLQPKNIEVWSITVWIHDQERMESFQAKENTFVEREAKESPFENRQKYAKLTAIEDWNIFFLFTDECPKYIF